MGSFNVTCGLTRLPILAGDAAVAVVIRRPLNQLRVDGAYELLFHHLDFPDEIITVAKGEYDDYGRLEGVTLPEELWADAIFFRLDAWDAALANDVRYEADKGAPPDRNEAPMRRLRGRIAASNVPFAEELWTVGKVAHRARINLAAGAGINLQQQEVGFLMDLAGIVQAAPLGYDDIGFVWPAE